MLKGRSLIEPLDLSLEELDEILNLADEIIADPMVFSDVCKGRVLKQLC